MNNSLIIIGASGHGKVAADIAIKMNKWQNISFLDDDDTIKTVMGFEVIGKITDAYKHKDKADFFVAIGNNNTRERTLESLINDRLSIVSLIHPSAIIATDVKIGVGTIIMAGVIINPCSSIGKGCIINTSATIDHDNIIEDYVHISPRVSTAGNVIIGKNTWLGIGSIVSNNITICQNATIGAGAAVIDNLYQRGVYVGIPARKI